MSFVHLHNHSQYSLLQATMRFKPMVAKAAEWGMPAVALTDKGNMFGAVEFYFAAKGQGIKPIIGLEVYIAPGSRFVKGENKELLKTPNRRLVLLAQNISGYQNLCKISSAGYKEGFYYKPRVDFEVLKEFSENIICLSGGEMGLVPWTFQNKGKDEAVKEIENLKSIYNDSLYLEVAKNGNPMWEEVTPFLQEVSRDKQVKLVATNDVHYLERGEKVAQEVLICIDSNKTLQDESRFRLPSSEYYFKSPDEMKALFKDLPEAVESTLEISDRCHIEFKLKDDDGQPIYHLPTFPTEEASLTEAIKKFSRNGLERRLDEARKRGEEFSEEDLKRYDERLDYELSVIDNMGFNGYFLIVQDFINWAKEHDIPVGPGRGSGAGSLVAYCLYITDLDPMPYNLIFERFLNPERVSMPDFDIDFCQENRGRVIDYVTQKYGEGSVSQIITYGKLQARAAIRDVGRVMGMTYAEVDVVAKLIPDVLGINLKQSIEMEPRLRELMDIDPKVGTLMELAQKIEGLVRHAGIHAAGVIIADGDIVNHAPLYRGVDGENVVQYDMKHSEKIGLIKFDFLGLKTLTHIQYAFQLIESNRNKKLTTKNISLKDPGIYEIMCKGDTAGIFQFEGEGITDLIKKAQPSNFEDIVAINALYRPGPMDMIPDYLKRKHGEVEVEYLFPELEEILKETYGIVVYQEQVQLIAAKIASYSLGEADMLRRAMGKKIAEEMAKQKKRFLSGAQENDFEPSKAEQLFDTMAEFAKYGFNKSHAAAYCVVAAYTAYLKNYYPVEFFAALLSTEMRDTDKVVKYVKDAQRHDVVVKSPHINHSDYKFTVSENTIYFSLGAIKGVGESAVEAILQAREKAENHQFDSVEHFFELVDLRRVNKKTVECLIKSGAFDGFGPNRAELLSGYPQFIERADQLRKDKEIGQASLFSLDESVMEQEKVQFTPLPPWRRSIRLAYEKEVLGFYLSDHPLNGMENLVQLWANGSISSFEKKEHQASVVVLGLVSSLKEIITKKGTRMAFAQLEDLTGSVELVIFPKTYADFELPLKEDGPLLIRGRLEKEKSAEGKVIVESVELPQNLYKSVKKVNLKLDPGLTQEALENLLLAVKENEGETPFTYSVQLKDLEKEVYFQPSQPKTLRLTPELFERIGAITGNLGGVDVS